MKIKIQTIDTSKWNVKGSPTKEMVVEQPPVPSCTYSGCNNPVHITFKGKEMCMEHYEKGKKQIEKRKKVKIEVEAEIIEDTPLDIKKLKPPNEYWRLVYYDLTGKTTRMKERQIKSHISRLIKDHEKYSQLVFNLIEPLTHL